MTHRHNSNLLKTYLEFNDDMGDKLNILRRDQESVVNQHIRLRMTIRDLNLKSKYLIGNATVIHESDINGLQSILIYNIR